MISLPALPYDVTLSCHDLVEEITGMNERAHPASFGPTCEQWDEVKYLQDEAIAWIIQHPDQYVLQPYVDHNRREFYVHWLLLSPALAKPCEYPDGQVREAVSVGLNTQATHTIQDLDVALDFCHLLNKTRQERTQADA